jgi:hypothetical protein
VHRIGLIAGLSLFAVATTYRDRLKTLQTDAAAQRQKLGLDNDREKLYAKYPTPEFDFDGDPIPLTCGGSSPINVSGKFPAGTAFLVNDDDVEIIGAKTDSDGWHAKLKAAPNAAPSTVNLHAVAPVSGAERSMRIAQVSGKYEMDLKFDDGWTAHFAGDALAWKKGGETRSTRAEMDADSGHIRLRWEQSPEAAAAQEKQVEAMKSAYSGNEMQEAMKKMQGCMQKADPGRQTCMEAVNADMEKLNKKVSAQQEAAENARPTAAWGCNDALLDAHAGALSGTATCAPHDRKMKITGSLKCLRE